MPSSMAGAAPPAHLLGSERRPAMAVLVMLAALAERLARRIEVGEVMSDDWRERERR